MTTTLRPTGPIQHEAAGGRSRAYEVCVNGRPVGAVELATHRSLGPTTGTIRSLTIDEADRRRGRGTVAALAAEEVLRAWDCRQVVVSVPPEATAALRLSTALGYVERSRNMVKQVSAGPPPLPPGTAARPMSEAEFEPWRQAAVAAYAQSWADRGLSPQQARAKSTADHEGALPQGLATPGTWLRVLSRGEERLGTLFAGRTEVLPGEQGVYVYDVEVRAAHRGQGHGRSLMLLAEHIARDAGLGLVGLHVFAANTPAVRLYESLGYRVTAVNAAKPLL
ncbi:GNAT family N-acetyltransferase [Streptomyces sp. HNM0663]|uniref:GNAT family N-acetyltransferase n=1 Tax=Streptomyces chengmaiensis TaxID=3040919 RepID=A0ABT6HU76_9ACTN|nr:GNAT family N-acetyltransferase [Streptomyces chengmaiensis]MDH2392278.1 GNAT family N-acetyltransferase [Streptomyces chengmaiensis]